MRGPRTGAVVLAVAALVLSSSSCAASGGAGDGAASAATVPHRPPTVASTSAPPALDTVPAEIDGTYAERLVAAFDELEDAAVQAFVAADGPTLDWDRTLQALYDEPVLEGMRAEFGRIAAEGGADDGSRGPRTATVELVDSSPSCLAVWADRTWQVNGPRRDRWLLAFVPRTPAPPANPTAWALARSFAEEQRPTWGEDGPCP